MDRTVHELPVKGLGALSRGPIHAAHDPVVVDQLSENPPREDSLRTVCEEHPVTVGSVVAAAGGECQVGSTLCQRASYLLGHPHGAGGLKDDQVPRREVWGNCL